MPKPVWFITGASRGFGREIVLEALRQGHRVVTTARNTADVHSWLPAEAIERTLVLPLDVVDQAQIRCAVNSALARFGAIDVLVNNAGYGYLTAVEEGEEHEIRSLFDVNFFGLAALTRAVLPHMRERRTGTIVNISSVGGFVGFAGSGYYAATKFAVEGLSESLHREVSPLGLRVLLVEPGPFRTDWAGDSMRQSPHRIADYEPTSGSRRRQVAAGSGSQDGDPARAARVIVDAVLADNAPFRLPLGRLAITAIHEALDGVAKDIAPWEDRSSWADAPLVDESVA